MSVTRFSMDLPFFLPLNENNYLLRVGEHEIEIRHSVVEREDFDPRIGGITAGSFGFIRDQFGALRYSKLTTDLDDEQLGQIGAVLTGRASSLIRPDDFEGKAAVVQAVINRFLDKYRVTTRALDVKPIGPWDLALLHFDDGRNSGELRLYGGGITLPPEGQSPDHHQTFLDNLADPEPIASFELAAVDALRVLEDGQTLESMVTAIGALEAALDLFFGRTWRLSDPRVLPPDAAAPLSVSIFKKKTRDVYTLEDVLEKATLHQKVKAYVIAQGFSDEQCDGLLQAIYLRNLAVHGGVRMSKGKAGPHVQTLVELVLNELAPRIKAECPILPRAELLYACEEALGNDCSPDLEQIVNMFLTPHGLTAKLYNQRHERNRMESERFGDTLVLKISFQDFAPNQVNLFIAQALLYHRLERRGDVAQALAADEPAMQERRAFFQVVAGEMTRTVWQAAINRCLRELGFDQLVQHAAEQRATELRARFSQSFVEPRFEELGYWVDYLGIAQTAAELPAADRNTLLAHIARVAPRTAQRSRDAIPLLERVDFDDLGSIREALIGVHDAHDMILASVSIFDPVTRQRHGLGLRLEDLGVTAVRPTVPSSER
jgi:hypothetical protein